jgi:hypothetical protein
MAYQGEYFIRRYGYEAVQARPPIQSMLEMGLQVGGGTDGTRVASYHPWTCLWWLVTGKTVGGTEINTKERRLDRLQALKLWTTGSAWFSGEEKIKGTLTPGSLADLAVLSDDYFTIEEDEIRGLESVLTMVNGVVVHGAAEYASESPELPPVSPDWSPVVQFGGYHKHKEDNPNLHPGRHGHEHPAGHRHWILGADGRAGQSGCGCSV